MASSFKIDEIEAGLTALDALATPLPDPQWEFREYRKMVRLGDNSMRGVGARTVIWNFPLLEVAQITMLESFQSTAPIYIQSLKRDGTTAIFEVLMNWNDPRQDGSHKPGLYGYRVGLEIEFIILSEV